MDKKLFIGLFVSFIAATIIGTLSHESGHYIAAKYFGYDARINYKTTYWHSPNPHYPVESNNSIAILLGGPVQTMLTGTIGLILLIILRKRFFLREELTSVQWIIIFVSLFWLRQTANFFVWITEYLFTGTLSPQGDEIRIAKYLHLPEWSLISITAMIGVAILLLIVFLFIPSKQRLAFLFAGLIGGVAGYYLWLVAFGKYILP